MITPVVHETTWQPRLRAIPAWQPSRAPMVVIVPHPDDETLAAGGLIAAQRAHGVDVTVIAVTDGEHAYADNVGLAATRRQEQACALARLGVPAANIVRLGLIDSGVTGQHDTLVDRLREFITAETQVVAPWAGDFHPDHIACARAAEQAAHRAGAALVSYFFWTWHRGTLASLDGLNLARFALNDECIAAKREALACHHSQLHHQPEPEILPETLLWPARLPFEVFAL